MIVNLIIHERVQCTLCVVYDNITIIYSRCENNNTLHVKVLYVFYFISWVCYLLKQLHSLHILLFPPGNLYNSDVKYLFQGKLDFRQFI